MSDSPAPPVRAPRPAVPSAVLGTFIFVVAEVMFFSGLISAFTISKAGALPGTWPVPGQPRLPAEATALNTALLLLSGVVLVVAHRLFRRRSPVATWVTLAAWLLGVAFVALQGVEWVTLLRGGLTLTSSQMGAFFYIIVGGHALHAVGALLAMGWGVWLMHRERCTPGYFFGVQTFWYFVVMMWPFIYGRVYF